MNWWLRLDLFTIAKGRRSINRDCGNLEIRVFGPSELVVMISRSSKCAVNWLQHWSCYRHRNGSMDVVNWPTSVMCIVFNGFQWSFRRRYIELAKIGVLSISNGRSVEDALSWLEQRDSIGG